jgi:hypothetical protein
MKSVLLYVLYFMKVASEKARERNWREEGEGGSTDEGIKAGGLAFFIGPWLAVVWSPVLKTLLIPSSPSLLFLLYVERIRRTSYPLFTRTLPPQYGNLCVPHIDISFRIDSVQYNQIPAVAMGHLFLYGAAAHCTIVVCVETMIQLLIDEKGYRWEKYLSSSENSPNHTGVPTCRNN